MKNKKIKNGKVFYFVLNVAAFMRPMRPGDFRETFERLSRDFRETNWVLTGNFTCVIMIV